MNEKKDYTKGKYKKYRFLLRKVDDADMLTDMNCYLDNNKGSTKIDWLRDLFAKTGIGGR